ncbi:hypothetical protein F8M41_009756 [Gigaspora margarita]|uniref:Uncharacterized protein n=1 Tax=Gigaspora margarita TaxID=4874 RepID=A0A8H4EQC1_GIGMA|nr:hypothetical protein F8M41_009756 [Gigaspora margarita]
MRFPIFLYVILFLVYNIPLIRSCRSDKECKDSHLFGPGFVCSNNVQAGTAGDCIYACHVPGDCQSGTCAKTSPHWLCTCKTDSDCLVGNGFTNWLSKPHCVGSSCAGWV